MQIVQSQFTELRLHWTFNILKDQSWESKIISPKAKARNKKSSLFFFSLSLIAFKACRAENWKLAFLFFFYEIQKENRNEWNGWSYYYVSIWDNFEFNLPILYITWYYMLDCRALVSGGGAVHAHGRENYLDFWNPTVGRPGYICFLNEWVKISNVFSESACWISEGNMHLKLWFINADNLLLLPYNFFGVNVF